MHGRAGSSAGGAQRGSNAQRAVRVLLLAAVALSLAVLATLLLPHLGSAPWPSRSISRSPAQAATLADLQAENARLRATVATLRNAIAMGAGGGQPAASAATNQRVLKADEVAINLFNLVGPISYYGGISFDAHKCGLPYKVLFPDATAQQLQEVQDRFAKDLLDAMADVLGKPLGLPTSYPWESRQPGQPLEQATERMAGDARTERWRRRLTRVASRYLFELQPQGRGVRSVLRCATAPTSATLADAGLDFCPQLSEDEVVAQLGYHPVPQHDTEGIARDAVQAGLCTKSPDMVGSFGQWLIQRRMHNVSWMTFNTANLDQDAVVFLYDILYEHLAVFKRQYFLGSVVMQHPFDLLSISDIIWTVKPDLIIETGTANGGSALLWASMLHLNGVHDGRVLTVDVTAPAWEPGAMHWGGVPKADATKHPLWAKHVTFVQGSSTAQEVWTKVKEHAIGAQRVLVLLDSHHSEEHVLAEAKLYCAFVTPGSYCVLEDTKLSRFSANGPLEAAIKYTRAYPRDFIIDRERELVFTHHALGYLKRLEVVHATPFFNLTTW